MNSTSQAHRKNRSGLRNPVRTVGALFRGRLCNALPTSRGHVHGLSNSVPRPGGAPRERGEIASVPISVTRRP